MESLAGVPPKQQPSFRARIGVRGGQAAAGWAERQACPRRQCLLLRVLQTAVVMMLMLMQQQLRAQENANEGGRAHLHLLGGYACGKIPHGRGAAHSMLL
eukprot:1145757-Pelagomonas_calceolata.AAC.14